ncbi:MAG: hypothetical protein RIT32_745 [Actinomycetota bacterium]
MTPNDDAMRSFLSMGAQVAEEIRRRLDEAAANVGSPNSSAEVDLDAIKLEIIAQLRAEIGEEVERAITRLGIAREDELASLRARIERLES